MISILRGGLLGKRGWLLSGGCSFSVKNKLKSEIFNGKTFYKTKMFFSAVTENLNWEVLTNNSVTFKRWDGVKDQNFNMGDSLKNPIFKGGSW